MEQIHENPLYIGHFPSFSHDAVSLRLPAEAGSTGTPGKGGRCLTFWSASRIMGSYKDAIGWLYQKFDVKLDLAILGVGKCWKILVSTKKLVVFRVEVFIYQRNDIEDIMKHYEDIAKT